MGENRNSLDIYQYLLEPGYIFAPAEPTNISSVVGSCVAVCIYDKKRKSGGMCHFKLPITKNRLEATVNYGNVAVLTLINIFMEQGAKSNNLEAQIIGGAFNPDFSDEDIGKENVEVAKKILFKKKIRIVSEDVRGERGRKLVFNSSTGQTTVLKVDRLRKNDWYPYNDHR